MISSILSFFQEYSASNAIQELSARVQVKSIVIRNGVSIEVASKNLVPGDIVKLSAGTIIPADGLIIESMDLFINQSVLTGKSIPVEKKPNNPDKSLNLIESPNCVFMGTNVQSGSATMLIVKTGETTEFGQIAEKLKVAPPENEFERGIREFDYLLTKIMLVIALAIFAINLFFNRPAIDSLLFFIALAVGITPQLLPAIIRTLSKGSRIMAKEGVIVRRLSAIENFGSMDVLCTDKTGTLTEGIIRIDGSVDVNGNNSDLVFKLAYLNAAFQTGMHNPLDETIIKDRFIDISNIKKIGEIPFDFTRERLSVIVEENNQISLIVKGALNNIFPICSHVQIGDSILEIDEKMNKVLNEQYAKFSNQGIRVLGVA